MNTQITLNPLLILIISFIYFALSIYFYRSNLFLLHVIRFIPVLFHEFGHAFACQLTGGKVHDIVIVASRKEQQQTNRSGYAITETKPGMNTFITLISGYLMTPAILFIAILCLMYGAVILFWIMLMLIYIYYFVKTSRKVLPLMMLILFIGTSYFLKTYYPMIRFELVSYLYHFIIAILFADLIITLRTITLVYFQGNINWDGAQLSKVTRIPAFLYLSFFIGIHIAAIYFTSKYLIDLMM